MQTISTIGLDIAKSVFQVHGVDAASQEACYAAALGMCYQTAAFPPEPEDARP
jgi:hypothetical protein